MEKFTNLVNERLKQLRITSGKSQADLAESMGISQVSIYKVENGITKASEKYLKKYADYFNIAEDDIIRETVIINKVTADRAKIDIISATPCCGNGNETEEEVIGHLAIPMEHFRGLTFTSPENVKMMRVTGDSMTPTINDGDYILADVSNKTPADGIYVIRTLTGLAVKRIQIGISAIEIISDNPQYRPLTSSAGELQIVGKVVKICNFKAV